MKDAAADEHNAAAWRLGGKRGRHQKRRERQREQLSASHGSAAPVRGSCRVVRDEHADPSVLPRRDEQLAVLTTADVERSEEHTSELQSRRDLVCRLLLEKKKTHILNSASWTL